MRGGSQSAFCQSRRPSFERQQNAAHANDGKFQSTADLRLSIFDFRFGKCPPLWRLTNVLFKVRNGAVTRRDVKNGATSGDVYENTGDDDKMSIEKHGHFTKIHQLCGNRQQSVGLLGEKCTRFTIIRGESCLTLPCGFIRSYAEAGANFASICLAATMLRSSPSSLAEKPNAKPRSWVK